VNAGVLVLKAAQQHPERVAVRFADAMQTYEGFASRCLRLAAGLRASGLEKGDRVLIGSRNRPEVLETLWGAFLGGFVAVPLNVRLHPREMAYIAYDSGARAFVHGEELNEGLAAVADDLPRPLVRVSTAPSAGEIGYDELLDSTPATGAVEVADDDPAWLFYTSGTTGRPKGVVWTHETIMQIVLSHLTDIVNLQPEDTVLHAAPLSHGSGVVALATFAKGTQNVILHSPSFDPGVVFDLVERWRVTTIAFLAPTQITMLCDTHARSAADLSALRSVCYGGAPMYTKDIKRAIDEFGPIFVQLYGQGESPLTITYLRREDHERYWRADDPRLASAGVARTNVEVRVVDIDGKDVPIGTPGEVVVRGGIVMAGYWRNPDATRQTMRDGWVWTGDVGSLDDTGHLFLLDRSKDMIVSGGVNIYPREVEDVLLLHPAVHEVAVIGVPDEHWGEHVHAVVARHRGNDVDGATLIQHCVEHLASFKKPRSIEFVDALPKNAYGKIMKQELREQHWRGHDRRIAGG
jgi:acyl-CoA synthetase (AMP-forming)/AMP-acid ligase II